MNELNNALITLEIELQGFMRLMESFAVTNYLCTSDVHAHDNE